MKTCLGCGQPRHVGLCKPTAVTRAATAVTVAGAPIEWHSPKPHGHAQPKVYASNAEKQRAYRARKRDGR